MGSAVRRSQRSRERAFANPPIRVALANDYHTVRRNLRLALQKDKDVAVVTEADDLVTAIRRVNIHVPDVLLLDLRMPNGSSTELIRRLRSQVPQTRIVVMAPEESPVFARHALDAGAIAYVLTAAADSELPIAIRRASYGEEYVSPRVAAALDGLQRAVDGDGLSPRETDVLRLTALGFTCAEISHELHLSPRTIETHRERIHHKLGLAKRWQLVRYALDHSLIGNSTAAHPSTSVPVALAR
jgi:DNA-binding NarL/FixJ family response regulator